ncbi:BNR-4 repeat-containing protein [Halococcus sp. PRR34]|uniref:BNR-4 repeat-containing protein n=1 Tax=Halococcus sp. PRR34 TaxID=3020830 RepID=UPI002362B8FB|nr:BNR-4 repeat-containing protein [Halococcus sp. PRR34]
MAPEKEECAESDHTQATAADDPVLFTNRGARHAVTGNHGKQAEYVESEDTTFVVIRGDLGQQYALTYDHETGERSPHYRIDEDHMADDRHATPALAIDDDGIIHVFYSSHNSYHYYARSENPYDITSWERRGQMTDIPEGTYPIPLVYENDVYVLYRTGGGLADGTSSHGDSYPVHEFATIVRSTDSGNTWEDIGPVLDVTEHPEQDSDAYITDFDERDGKFHISWFVANGDNHDDYHSDAYHAYYDPEMREMFDLAGNSYGDTVAWSQREEGHVRVYNGEYVTPVKHALGEDQTHVVFGAEHPERGDGQYFLATWDDGWELEEIPGATHNYKWKKCDARISDDGYLEAHLITDDDGVLHLENGRRHSVGNYDIYAKDHHGKWTSRRLIERYYHEGVSVVREGAENIAVVRNGHDEFAALGAEYTPMDDSRQRPMARVWAIGDIDISPALQYVNDQPKTVAQRHRFSEDPIQFNHGTGDSGWIQLLEFAGAGYSSMFGLGIDASERALHLLGHENWTDSVSLSLRNVAENVLEIHNDGTARLGNNGLVYPKKDISKGGYTGVYDGEIVQNETSQNDNPEGLWRWDEDGAQWKVERDPTTTVSPK